MLAERREQISFLDILDNAKEKRITKKRTREVIEYIEQVHSEDDGYITIAIRNKKVGWQQYHFKKENLEDNINKILSLNTNTYISINSFYYAKRGIESLRKINSLYLELDKHTDGKMTDEELENVMYYLEEDYFYNKVPRPNLIVYSGRGLHLYWVIENLPKQGIPLWQIVENRLYAELKDFNVEGFEIDKAAMDLARVFRLPQSKNTKAKVNCKVLDVQNFRYRLDDIIEYYFPDLKIINKPKKNKAKYTKKENKIINSYNIYTLHYYRLQDILKLMELRKGNFPERRELLCFLYRYYSCLYIKDTNIALENTIEFNKQFVDPLDLEEVIKATKSAEEAFKQWQETQDKIGKCPIYNSSKKDYIIKGYNYRNTTLIKIFSITEEEQKQLKTIIGTEEKYRRNNLRRYNNRRNEDGLTSRQQQKKNRIEEILKLKENGLNQTEIAKKIGISRQAVSKLLRSIKKCVN